MRITGIIAEYNPFHNGHAYHLEQTRRITDADYLVVVMSGNFVQRGEPAIADKYCRTRMALSAGADLVLELPNAYACASAETFAGGAVSLLNGLGCVNALCFGSECGEIPLLESYADVLVREPQNYRDLLQAFLRQGNSFPLARSKALHEYFSYTNDIVPCSLDDADCRYESQLLSQPNNTLGIEYLKALKLQNSSIKPYTLARKGAGYHDAALIETMSSATAIRTALLQSFDANTAVSQKATGWEQIPFHARRILKDHFTQKGPLALDDLSSVLHYTLLRLSEQELTKYTDISPELAARIKNLLPKFQTASSFADLVKTKNITHTRITRAFCHILLQDYQKNADQHKALAYPVYARILGFRASAQPLLTAIDRTARIPLISKPADGLALLHSAATTGGQAKFEELSALYEQDTFASHVYEAIISDKYQTEFCHEDTRQMIVAE